jgi:hypothetical protein
MQPRRGCATADDAAGFLLGRLVPHPGKPAVEVGDSDPAPRADPMAVARALPYAATAHAARGARRRRRHPTYDDVAAARMNI